jgi:hypothetical protein
MHRRPGTRVSIPVKIIDRTAPEAVISLTTINVIGSGGRGSHVLLEITSGVLKGD